MRNKRAGLSVRLGFPASPFYVVPHPHPLSLRILWREHSLAFHSTGTYPDRIKTFYRRMILNVPYKTSIATFTTVLLLWIIASLLINMPAFHFCSYPQCNPTQVV